MIMTIGKGFSTLALFTAVVLFTAAPLRAGEAPSAASRPPEILSWRHQVLPPERYVELAGQWDSYVKAHPREARAWVEWADALRYSGQWTEACKTYARAFEADTNDVAAVAAFCGSESSQTSDPARWKVIQERLLRAASADPGYADTFYALWLSSLRLGDEATAREALRRILASGDMTPALYDYGYNMLAGAPRDAIILTNGDNDTYPPLAVQAVTGTRADVAIVNVSLLNTVWYIRYQRDHGLPIGLDDAAIETLRPTKELLISGQIERRLFENLRASGGTRPLYYSVTVPDANRKIEGCHTVVEGILERIEPGAAAERDYNLAFTRELFETVYRLDSMSDERVDWKRESSVAQLGRNYVYLLRSVGDGLLADRDAAGGAYLYRALAMVTAQGDGDTAREILVSWEKRDPRSDLLAKARAVVEGARGGK